MSIAESGGVGTYGAFPLPPAIDPVDVTGGVYQSRDYDSQKVVVQS